MAMGAGGRHNNQNNIKRNMWFVFEKRMFAAENSCFTKNRNSYAAHTRDYSYTYVCYIYFQTIWFEIVCLLIVCVCAKLGLVVVVVVEKAVF